MKKTKEMGIVLVYMDNLLWDDLLIIEDNESMIYEDKQVLHKQFKLKYLGELFFGN